MRDKAGCVYIIKCLVNNKVYIGQTMNFNGRMGDHRRLLNKCLHSNKYLQEDWNKFGEDKFVFETLEENLMRGDRLRRETYFINSYGGIESPNVYNYQDNVSENDEMRQLVSIGQRGKPKNLISVEKMRKTKTGKKLTEEHKQHIRESCVKFIGDKNPAKRPEVRRKISEAVRGEKNGMYGKHHSKEARQKMSIARKGRKPWNMGKPMEEKTKEKISKTLKGHEPWNTGKCKYSKEQIEVFRQEYMQYKSYMKVQQLHPEICYDVIISLIKYGKTNKPNKKK